MTKKRTKQHEVAPGVFVSSGRISQLRYPERRHARQAVRYAVKSGRLVPLPCEVCGVGPTEAHHVDYAEPLTVQWLCIQHHRKADRAMGRTRRTDYDFVYTPDPVLHRAAAALGKLGGKARARKYNPESKSAKAAAARENGKKGGRPLKSSK